jgi:hypothetical protein
MLGCSAGLLSCCEGPRLAAAAAATHCSPPHIAILSGPQHARHALTPPLLQAFPFEGCPPTTSSSSESPGLRHVLQAVCGALPGIGTASRNSLVKVGWAVERRCYCTFMKSCACDCTGV